MLVFNEATNAQTFHNMASFHSCSSEWSPTGGLPAVPACCGTVLMTLTAKKSPESSAATTAANVGTRHRC